MGAPWVRLLLVVVGRRLGKEGERRREEMGADKEDFSLVLLGNTILQPNWDVVRLNMPTGAKKGHPSSPQKITL